MKKTTLFVWILFLTLCSASSYCMEDESQESRLIITALQQTKYKNMCELLESCTSEKPFVFVATKVANSDQLRWEAQKNMLPDIHLASHLPDNPFFIKLQNSTEYSTCIDMKVWGSNFMCLEPITFLLLQQASQYASKISFIDHCTLPEIQAVYVATSKLLNHAYRFF